MKIDEKIAEIVDKVKVSKIESGLFLNNPITNAEAEELQKLGGVYVSLADLYLSYMNIVKTKDASRQNMLSGIITLMRAHEIMLKDAIKKQFGAELIGSEILGFIEEKKKDVSTFLEDSNKKVDEVNKQVKELTDKLEDVYKKHQEAAENATVDQFSAYLLYASNEFGNEADQKIIKKLITKIKTKHGKRNVEVDAGR